MEFCPSGRLQGLLHMGIYRIVSALTHVGLVLSLACLDRAALAEAPPEAPPETPPEDAPQPSLATPLTLRLDQADLQSVVMALAQQNNISIVGGEKLKGTVTAYLNQVSVMEALQAILASGGFGLRENGKILEIMDKEQLEKEVRERPKELPEAQAARTVHPPAPVAFQTRMFPVEFADLDRVVSLLVPNVLPDPAGVITIPEFNLLVIKGTESQLNDAAAFLKILQEQEKKKAPEVNETPVNPTPKSPQEKTVSFPIHYAELDQVVTSLIPQVLPDNTRITTLRDSNVLLVRGTDEELGQVAQRIALVDVITPQILIQTKIVEVSQEKASQLGIKWTGIFSQDPKKEARIDLSQVSANIPTFQLGYVFGEVEMALDALVQNKAADILSAPQITTSNNKVAIIRVEDRVPVIKRTVQIVNQQTITTDEVSFQDAGLSLEVTPRVIGQGYVYMKLLPSVKELVAFTATDPPQPIINAREATTEVILKDGAWVAIGGLMRDTSNTFKRKVPGLGDIPIIRLGFRTKQDSSLKSNLVILVSGKILDETGAETHTRDEQEKADKLREKPKDK